MRKPAVSRGLKRGTERLDQGQFELVPIDHGYCLPEALEPPYFEWLYWPQAKLPFGEEELRYIANLDIEADKRHLRAMLPILSEECLRTLEVATLLLQKAAAAGLSLHEIGQVMSRPLVGMDEELSELEKICIASKQEVESIICCCNQDGVFSGSDETDSSCCGSSTLIREEELQFCIDDVQGEQLAEDVEQLRKQYSFSMSFSPYCEIAAGPHVAEPELDAGMRQLVLGVDQQEDVSFVCPEAVRKSHALVCHKASRSVSLQIPSVEHRRDSVDRRGPLRQRKLSLQISCPNVRGGPGYPSPVEGAAPSSTNDIFRHMGKDDWLCFIRILTERIDAALAEGCWKLQDAIRGRGQQASNFGMSCPRF